MRQLFYLFLIAVFSLPVALWADECLLVDQSVRKGTVQKVDDQNVYLLENGEQVVIIRSDVESITYENGKKQSFLDIMYLKDGRTVQGRVLRVTDSFCEINPEGNEVFEKVELNYILKIVYDNGRVVMPSEKAVSGEGTQSGSGSDILIGYEGQEVFRGKFIRQGDGVIIMQNSSGEQRGVPVYMVKKMVRADGSEVDYEQEKKAHEQKAAASRDTWQLYLFGGFGGGYALSSDLHTLGDQMLKSYKTMLQLYEPTAIFSIDSDSEEESIDVALAAQGDVRFQFPNWLGIGAYASSAFVGITYMPTIKRNGEDYARFDGWGVWNSYGGYVYYKYYLDLPSVLFVTSEPHSFLYVLGGFGAGYSTMKFNLEIEQVDSDYDIPNAGDYAHTLKGDAWYGSGFFEFGIEYSMLCAHIGIRLDIGSTDDMKEDGQAAQLQSGKNIHVNRTTFMYYCGAGVRI